MHPVSSRIRTLAKQLIASNDFRPERCLQAGILTPSRQCVQIRCQEMKVSPPRAKGGSGEASSCWICAHTASSARVTLIEARAPSLFVLGAPALAYISGRALAHCRLNARSGLAAASFLSRACVSELTLARRPSPLMQPPSCPCAGWGGTL